jgi:N-hydroxyarylamine O-acetyltransferase
MDISAYLQRISYDGTPELTAETLTQIHRAHLLAIPYENLDIHLGRSLSLDEERIFEKIVTQRRGGWCYEMNGLLAWALRELGFPVTLLASAVNRATNGDGAEGNHLILMVELDRPYLVDVGFGNGILEPLPLEAGSYLQGFLTYRLEHDGTRWQFVNQAYGGDGFDFTLEPRRLSDFSAKCYELQTSTQSGFVRTTVCHRFTPESILSLRGAVLHTVTHEGRREDTMESREAYETVLREQFDLHLPADEVAMLWQKVRERHVEWLKARS